MTAPACERAVLVEPWLDERLDGPDAASMQRHVAACGACARAAEELGRVQAVLREVEPLAALDHRRARLALLRAAAETPAPVRASRPRLILAVVAAAVVVPVAVWASSTLLVRPLEVAPASSSVSPAVSEASSVPSPQASSRALPEVPSSTSIEPAQVAPPRRSPAARVAPSASRPSSGDGSTASREFADALDAVSRGDFAAGARKLEGFAERHADDARVDEAAYLEAVALERAGRADEAKAAARRYLARFPNGAHRAQAARLAR